MAIIIKESVFPQWNSNITFLKPTILYLNMENFDTMCVL